jgi:transposase
VSAGVRFVVNRRDGGHDRVGTDTHKKTHTCAGVDALTASARGELTAPARKGSFGKLLRWARAPDRERVWALEDCRHVSGAFERFLIARGERVVRVAPKHMAGARRSARERGKSDSIDALSVARATLREGLENLPGAHLDGRALDIRVLSDHRDDLVAARTQEQRLRWHLHDLWPELEISNGALDTGKWLGKVSRRLARAERTPRVRIARELVRQIAARTIRIRELESELAQLVSAYAPQLLAERGCGPLTAAKLIGEIAGADRFGTDAKLARTSGTAPIPASTGQTTATASTAAATASSTARYTASPSTKRTGTRTPPPTSSGNRPGASPAKKRSAASSATSPAASGNSSTTPAPTTPSVATPATRTTASRTIVDTAPAVMPCLT